MTDNSILANQSGNPFFNAKELRDTIANFKKCNFEASCFIESIPG